MTSYSTNGVANRLAKFGEELTAFQAEQRHKMIELGKAAAQHVAEAEQRVAQDHQTLSGMVDGLYLAIAELEQAVYRQRWWQVWRPGRR